MSDTDSVVTPDQKVIYDPNLEQILNVKVLGLVVAASHDKGSTSSNQRHMIDLYCLKMLEGGEQLVKTMIPSVPAYTNISGLNMESQQVLGILNCPLKARCDRESTFVHVILDDVLVVDRLPVPLHISIQLLEAGFTPGLKALTTYNSAEDADNFRLKRENLPEHYHTHPFFKDDSSKRVVMTGDANGQTQSRSGVRSASSNATSVTPSLTCCGLTTCGITADKDRRLFICSRCKRIAYCCPEHQAQDWKRHKTEDICKKKT